MQELIKRMTELLESGEVHLSPSFAVLPLVSGHLLYSVGILHNRPQIPTTGAPLPLTGSASPVLDLSTPEITRLGLSLF